MMTREIALFAEQYQQLLRSQDSLRPIDGVPYRVSNPGQHERVVWWAHLRQTHGHDFTTEVHAFLNGAW